MRWEYLYTRNQLAAIFTALAFTVIGPYACYAGVCAQAEICAPKLCVRMCLIVVLHLSSLFLW